MLSDCLCDCELPDDEFETCSLIYCDSDELCACVSLHYGKLIYIIFAMFVIRTRIMDEIQLCNFKCRVLLFQVIICN